MHEFDCIESNSPSFFVPPFFIQRYAVLSKLKISTRLVLGFLILNLMIFGLNAYTYFTTFEIQDLLGGTVRAASNQTSLLEFQLNAFRMRAHAWSSYGTGETSRWEQAEKSAKDALGVLGELQKTTLNADRQKKLQEIRDNWDAYYEGMKGIRALGGSNPNLLTPQAEAPFKLAASSRKKFDDSSEDIKKLYAEALTSRSVHAAKTVDESNRLSLAFGAVSLLVGFVLSMALSRSIARPIKAITGAMTQLSQGNLDVEIPAADRQDEIGEMAIALKIFKDNAKQVESLRKAQEEAAAKAAVERKAAMKKMADDFEASILGVVKAVSTSAAELQTAAQNLTSAAERAQSQATTVAAAAQQTTANVQTVASAAEELTAAISEISGQVNQSAAITKDAFDEAAHTNDRVNTLKSAAEKINDVVELITSIASQTNLLALNATIEAARAGEAGKGFAVVANEVKGLASQTARATDEIGSQIHEVQTETEQAVKAIQNISGTIERVRQIAASIASAVEEQGAATREIARNVQQAATGTEEVSRTIGGVSQTAETTSETARNVLIASQQLLGHAEQLKSGVEAFLSGIREEKKAVLMEWSDALKIGIESIDKQHEKLVGLLNDLYEGFQSGHGRDSVGRVLDGLIDYTATHFKYEEDIFNRIGYAEMAAHKKEHEALVARVLEVQKKYRAGEMLTQEVMAFLKGWLEHHILGTDRRYVPSMRNSGIQ